MTFLEALETLVERGVGAEVDVRDVVLRLDQYFGKNHAKRRENGKGYSVGSNPSAGVITISQYFTFREYETYNVKEAILQGKSFEEMVSDINAIIDELAGNPDTPPNDEGANRSVARYYGRGNDLYTGD